VVNSAYVLSSYQIPVVSGIPAGVQEGWKAGTVISLLLFPVLGPTQAQDLIEHS